MRVALTLDDGPSQWTPAILDLLAEAGAHATFFVCGHAIPLDGGAGKLRRIVSEGHEVGNHTYSHSRLSAPHVEDPMAELRVTQWSVGERSGYEVVLWRAPFLDITRAAQEAAEELGLTHVGCDIDTADWMLTDPQRIADAALRAKDGDIILMHDGIPPDGGTGTRSRQPTVDALRIILRQPWEFLTVSDLWA